MPSGKENEGVGYNGRKAWKMVLFLVFFSIRQQKCNTKNISSQYFHSSTDFVAIQ